MLRVHALLLGLAVLLGAGAARAQRGGDYEVRREVQGAGGANANMPGLFNTEMAREGAVVVNLPFLNTYVGVSDDLTLGTDLLYVAPLALLEPSGLIIGRYRVHATSNTRTTVDTMVGGFQIDFGDNEDTRASSYVMAFGTNTLYVVSESHHLTANLLAGSFGYRYVNQAAPTLFETRLSGVLAGFTYTYNATDWLAFSAMLLPLSYLTGHVGKTGGIAEVNAADIGLDKFPWRVHASFRTGRFILEGGVMGISDGLAPWLNVGVELGGR